jgi:hypothetical protein
MTDSIQQFVNSYARVGATDLKTGGFFDSFYRHFIESSPVVAEKFRNTDMERQREMLRTSLDHMIYFAIDQEETAAIAQVAGVHSRSQTDIPETLYALWLDSLLATVSEFDPDYDDDIEKAWREAMAPAIDYMQRHYDSG